MFSRESVPSEAFADDLRASKLKSVEVSHVLSLVVAERLFVKVAKQVEGFDTHVGSADSTFQQGPVVLKSVRVSATIDVLDRMVNNLMRVISRESFIREKIVGIQGRSRFNVLANLRLKGMFLAVRNDGRANLATSLKDAHYGNFIFGSGASDATGLDAGMHVAGLATDERLIRLDFT